MIDPTDGDTGDLPGLTPEERKLLKKMFSSPLDIPQEWLAWLTSYLEAHPPLLPISQIFGFSGFTPKTADSVPTIEVCSSTSYGDLATVGPTLSELPDGEYLILFGCRANGGDTAGSAVIASCMSVSVNGAAADDNDRCQSDSIRGIAGTSIMRAVVKTLDGGGSNTIEAKYRITDSPSVTASPQIGGRWLTAIKIANP